jgi:16S rRNA (guanine527-N7)-methyltransferase
MPPRCCVIDQLARATGRPVSRETIDRLEAYANLLREENCRQNLVSASTIDQLWDRHILDSAQLVRFEPQEGIKWIDVGSGAGLPGIVIACLVTGPVTLVEPRRLRAEFLTAAIAELGLSAVVAPMKAERVTGSFGAITGRAVASLSRFLSMSDHLSTRKTVWVLPKGRSAHSELAEAQRSWQGVFHVEQSVTDNDAKIIVATEVRAKR